MSEEIIRDGFVLFWDGYLSNWHRCAFRVDDIEYNSAEQFMMAMKAKHFGDEKRLQVIMETDSPDLQKKIGRQVENFNVAEWEKVCEDYVFKGLVAKFTQNGDLLSKILNTLDMALVEASPYDKIWGIGMDASHPDATNPEKWQGKNLLGKVLMRVREHIQPVAGPAYP